ncbi:MAG: WD40 repeat domain-containing protein [Polyangiales bacterium]
MSDPPSASTPLKPLARLGGTSFLHDGGLLNLAPSPDGRTLHTLAHHGLSAVFTTWSADDGRKLAEARLRRKERFARSGGAIDASGTMVACTDATREGRRFCVDLWAPGDARPKRRIEPEGAAESTGDLEFTPDGAGLLRSHSAGVERWSTATGELAWSVAVPPLGKHWAASALAPGGAHLVVVHATEQRVELRRVDDGSVLRTLSLDVGASRRFCLSRDGRRLAARTDLFTVTVFDLAAGSVLARLPLPAVTQAPAPDGLPELGAWAFSPVGDALLVAVRTHHRTPPVVTMYELPSGVVRWQTTGPGAWGFRFCPTGARVFAVGGRRVRRLDVDTGVALAEDMLPGAEALRLAVTADGQRAVTVSDAQAHSDRHAHLWDVASGRVLRELAASELAASADGAVVALDGLAVTVLDPHRGDARAVAPGPVSALAISPDGATVVTVTSVDDYRGRTITQRAADTGVERSTATYHGRSTAIDALALSPDGRSAATTAIGAGVVHLRRLDDLTDRTPLAGHRRLPACLCFSPDGLTLASGDPKGRVILWDVRVATARATIELAGPVRSLAFAPGSAVLAATHGPAITVLAVADGAVVARLEPGDSEARALAFAADGRLFVAHADTTLGVYELAALAPTS